MPTFVSRIRKYQRQIWPCVILVLLTLAIRTPLLGIPFERDEGEYAYIGWRLEHHELPYRDWVDQKPPAIFWIYRLAFILPLDPVRAVHFMALLFAAASACALFFLALRFLRPFWAFISAALFAALSADPLLYGTEANTEMFMLLPLILSVMAFFSAASAPRPARGILFSVLAGIFIGIAIAFKQVAAVQWPLLVLLYPLFAGGTKSFRRILLFAAGSAAGIAVVWMAIVFYFALHHALNDFVYNVFTHNLEYVQGVSWLRRWNYLLGTLEAIWRDELIIWILSAVGLVYLFKAGRKKELLFFLGWMASSVAGVSASGYFFPHYFQQMLPVLCLTAALGAEALDCLAFLQTSRPWLRRAAFAGALMIPVVTVIYPFFFYPPLVAVDKIYPGNYFGEKKMLAERLAQITNPDDRVFIFGAEPEILFYARRVSATRYIFLFPLYGPYSDAKAKQIAVANEIYQSSPATALYLPNQLLFAPGSEQFFTYWTQSYLTENFRVDSCLAMTPAGNVEVVTDVPNKNPSLLKGLWIFGGLDIRKNQTMLK